MKFIVFWEWDPKDLDKIMERSKEWVKEQKAHPEKYAKWMRLQDGTAIGYGIVGQYKGFSLREVDDVEQMNNAMRFWNPLLQLSYYPIRKSPGTAEV
jgi:hypothetical protein